MKANIIPFGRIHISASKVKMIGSKGVSGEILKMNRLATQIASESKREAFPKRKFQETNLF